MRGAGGVLARSGPVVFALSAVLFGAIALLWRDADTWQTLVEFWKLPHGKAIGEAFMVAQIVGGVLLLIPRVRQCGALVLVVVYAAFSLACVPPIVATPKVYATIGSFFEQFCLLSGALALYVSSGSVVAATLLRNAARVGLGLSATSFTISQIVYLHFTASLVPAWIPPGQQFWAVLTTLAFGLAAVAILIKRRTRLAIRLMSTMLALFGVLVWVPALIAHPADHGNWSEFALTMLIAGAAASVGELRL